jgi:hypothetical protein
MMNDYSHNEKIDQFLEGKLSVEEHNAFVRSIEIDLDLAEMVKTQKVANEIIRTKQLLRLKEKMEADFSRPNWFNSLNSFLLFSLAALTIGLGTYWYFKVEKNNRAEKIYLPNSAVVNADTARLSSPVILQSTTLNKFGKEKNQIINSTTKDSTQKMESHPFIELSVVPNTTIDKTISSLEPVVLPTSSSAKKAVDCSFFALHHAIRISGSCQEEPTGKISIDVSEIKGGVSPYLISVSAIAPSFTDKTDFLYVKPGNYLVSIKDKNECLVKKEIEVEERACAKANVFAFTPELEKWKIPVQQKKYGTIKIFNKSGILVHQSEVSYESENYWEGISLSGQALETGYYTYIIDYTDGEQESGSVSIVR